VSNPEFPSSYRPDPRQAGRLGGAPQERRDRFGGRDSSGGGRGARGVGPGDPGRGENGSAGYQAAAADSGATGGRPAGWAERAGLSGLSWGRGDQAGRAPRGRGTHEEGSPGDRPARPDASRSRGRQPAPGAVGTRGTSASRERYAAARQRYAARVGAAGAGRAAGGRGATGVAYREAGPDGTGFNGNGYDNGYHGNGHDGGGYAGTGFDDTGYTGRRSGGRGGQSIPDGRRRRGRHGGGNGGDGGFPGEGRERRKGDWWRHWTLKKAVSVAAIAAGVMVVAGAAGVGMAYAKTPIPRDKQLSAIQAASTVYFSNNKTEVGQFGTFDRQPLLYNQIPAVLRNAVVAAEDKNFWHEGGISPTGILRAAYYDLTNSGGNLQGGSTITQQLVRNYYSNIGTAQTLSRKVKEIFVAQKLAQTTSKEQILKEYLNTVYLGGGTYGVGAAAQYYFGLSNSQLNQITPAQAAMIAAMIQQPSGFSPNPKAGAAYQGLVARWHYVLGAMADMGTLSQQDAAKATFPKVIKPFNNNWRGYRGYIMQAVFAELENTYHLSKNQIFTKGLHIVTTFNLSLMNSLYATVAHDRTLMRNGTPPALPSAVTVACGAAGCLPSYVHIGAVLEDPATGEIRAMYSGQNYNKNQYDNALLSRNQVGSSFKPYVLATAVKQGMNVQTSHLNGFSPLWIPPDSQPSVFASLKNTNATSFYEVQNDEVSNPDRPVSVMEATAMSLNTAYADLWHRVAFTNGHHSVVDMAKAFGVDVAPAPPDGNGSGLVTMEDQAGTALGQASLTVEEQANMIATLADGGVYHTPHVVREIINNGQVIPAKVTQREVLTPDQAAEVDWAMSFDMGSLGTANGLGLTNGQTVIAKTGTTNLSQSAFFLGATQRDAMAVGMFVSKPHCPASLGAECTSTQALAFQPPAHIQTLFGVGGFPGYGGQWPAIIWHDFFMQKFNNQAPEAWPAPPANYGTAWNLVPPLPKPKPKPRPCFGSRRRCQNNPGQTPTTAPCIPGGPAPCPVVTPSLPPFGGGARGAGAATAGGVAAGGLVATGVLASLLPGGRRRWRPRRRRAGPRGRAG
jgi:membrane peptidoglycan carboxypeptidase